MKKLLVRGLIIAAIILGFHRVCCLSVIDSFEDFFRYRRLSTEELRFTINRDDQPFINEIKNRVDPREGVLILHQELYFLAYYIYPVKLYKFRKGYFKTSKRYEFKDVDQRWIDDRNIKWVILEKDKLYLKPIQSLKFYNIPRPMAEGTTH